jgi:hypothetical protein
LTVSYDTIILLGMFTIPHQYLYCFEQGFPTPGAISIDELRYLVRYHTLINTLNVAGGYFDFI